MTRQNAQGAECFPNVRPYPLFLLLVYSGHVTFQTVRDKLGADFFLLKLIGGKTRVLNCLRGFDRSIALFPAPSEVRPRLSLTSALEKFSSSMPGALPKACKKLGWSDSHQERARKEKKKEYMSLITEMAVPISSWTRIKSTW